VAIVGPFETDSEEDILTRGRRSAQREKAEEKKGRKKRVSTLYKATSYKFF